MVVMLAIFIWLLRVTVFLFFSFLFCGHFFTQFFYSVVCSVYGVVGLLSLF